jgi:hypothetical protein
MEVDQGMMHDLEVTKWVVERPGFLGFSQKHQFECDPPNSRNSCRVIMSIFSSDLGRGLIELLVRRSQCRQCFVKAFVSELRVSFSAQKVG